MEIQSVPARAAQLEIVKNQTASPSDVVVTCGESWKCPVYVRQMPPCRNECPSSEDIRGYLTVVAAAEYQKKSPEEALDEAWHILTDKNPMPATHGRICPHPCEDGCNRKNKSDGPVAINNFERVVGDHGLERGLRFKKLTEKVRKERVAVIGSGPSGLSCVYQLARRGYPVTIFEAYDKPGGMLRYGIPSYRLPDKVLDGEIKNILDLGVELRCNTRVGVDIPFEELCKKYNAVYVAIGAHRGAKLNVPGEDAAGVFTAADYLNRINSGVEVDLGNKVVVVGGGDSAIDAARVSLRMAHKGAGDADQFDTESAQTVLDSARVSKRLSHAEVAILYRRTRAEMPAIGHEILEAEKEGVRIEFLAAPIEILTQDGRVAGIQCIRMELGEPDKSGRRRPIPVKGSEFTIEATAVISGIGQQPDLAGGLMELANQWGWINIRNNRQTGLDGVFAGGDVLGLGISSRSVGEGRKAAQAIEAYLNGREYKPLPMIRPIKETHLRFDYYKDAPRHEKKSLPAEERIRGFQEIYQRLTRDEAVAEAKRCMSCGLCFNCDQCRIYCPREAVSRDLARPMGQVMFTDYTKCNGCHICSLICPCGYIEMGMGL